MNTTWNKDQEYATPSSSLSHTFALSPSEAAMGFDESCPSNRSVNTTWFNRTKRKKSFVHKWKYTHAPWTNKIKPKTKKQFQCKLRNKPTTCVWFLCHEKKTKERQIIRYEPCFSTSGIVISDTFDADFNELYKMQTIQTIRPTMLVLSNVICKWSLIKSPPLNATFQFRTMFLPSGGRKSVWHFVSGLLLRADHVK